MKSKSFTVTMEVEKSATEVFNCITDVINWWSKDFKGNSKQLNDEFTINHPGQHYSKQKLIEIVPDKKIVWLVTKSEMSWLKNDKQEWTNTKMIFELNAKSNKTVLDFIHEGLVPEKECYTMCEIGWNMIIKSWLYHFIMTDTESPEMTKAAEIRNNLLHENAK